MSFEELNSTKQATLRNRGNDRQSESAQFAALVQSTSPVIVCWERSRRFLRTRIPKTDGSWGSSISA